MYDLSYLYLEGLRDVFPFDLHALSHQLQTALIVIHLNRKVFILTSKLYLFPSLLLGFCVFVCSLCPFFLALKTGQKSRQLK